MQKIILPFLVFTWLSLCQHEAVLAQDKHDFIWLLGHPPYLPAQKYGGTLLDFRTPTPSIALSPIGLDLGACTTVMCDAKGDLLFYANGFFIFNAQHRMIENGDSLNAPGREFSRNYFRGVGYSTFPGILSLPIPARPDQYAVFHLRYGDWTHIRALGAVLYTEVDMAANNGLGKVTSKNALLQQDTFDDNIAAVRHGNGRDWWVATFKFGRDSAFLWQLTPQGPKGPLGKKMGLPWTVNYYTRASSAFSPLGDRFARIDYTNHLQLFHFDRCTGEFSEPLQLRFPGDTLYASGVVFSPNGRFLYANTSLNLYQFDCEAKDIQQSKILIGTYDKRTSFYKLATNFYQMRLAPNGKIYMSAPNGVDFLHVIHAPDEKGAACLFEQRGVELPTTNGFCLPIHPNYRLYNWEGSRCDTVVNSGKQDFENIVLFPNPASEETSVVSFCCALEFLKVYNAAGVLMYEMKGIHPSLAHHRIDISNWPAGIYFVYVRTKEQGTKVFRLVVV